jgi:hypothetical protein
MDIRKMLSGVAGLALALQPVAASAQTACLSEREVSAIAIYSVPGLVQAVRVSCAGRLGADGYLARRGDSFSARYVALQPKVWPQAKAGLLKVLAGKSVQGRQNLDLIANLPDDAVRPLVDALIAQELSARIPASNCQPLERAIEAAAPIDPEVGGTLLGVIASLVNPQQLPVCAVRRS